MDIGCPAPNSWEVESSHLQLMSQPDRGAVWRVILMPAEVQPDVVEFVLVSAPWIWQEKRLNIYEAPSIGGVWSINTLQQIHSARNGLYTYQLGGDDDSAYLEILSHRCPESGLYCDIHNPLAYPEFVSIFSDTMRVSCIPGGTRAYIYFIADDRTVFPVHSIDTFRTGQDIISYPTVPIGFAGDFKLQQVVIEVQRGALPNDVVEFVLTNDGIDATRRTINILESPAVGSGVWTLAVGGAESTSSNGLYRYQLNGALLKLGAIAGERLYMDAGPVFDLTHAVPGTRYIFHWWPN